MTNAELIEHLKQFPMDASVICAYLRCSDYSILEAEDIRFYPAGKAETPHLVSRQWVLRNGQVMEYDEKTWDETEVPQFLSVITFPGN